MGLVLHRKTGSGCSGAVAEEMRRSRADTYRQLLSLDRARNPSSVLDGTWHGGRDRAGIVGRGRILGG
jgi:hypothetical protein